MPLYEYECNGCGRFEVIRKFSDPPLSVCPTCGKRIQKLPSAPAIQFKGAGWYVNDYARKPSGEGSSRAESEKTESGKTDSAKTESAKADSQKAASSPSSPSDASSSMRGASSGKPDTSRDTKASGGRSSK